MQKSESKSGIPSTMAEVAKKYAVVTGSNQGIRFGTVRKLASNGIMVCGLSDLVVFHQLDVADSASIAAHADFVKIQFGKLDILVNNAGVTGTIVDPEAMRGAAAAGIVKEKKKQKNIIACEIVVYVPLIETVLFSGKRSGETSNSAIWSQLCKGAH
ncbi:hypothetical protein ACE6H2_001708 [Prunus campanulata]